MSDVAKSSPKPRSMLNEAQPNINADAYWLVRGNSNSWSAYRDRPDVLARAFLHAVEQGWVAFMPDTSISTDIENASHKLLASRVFLTMIAARVCPADERGIVAEALAAAPTRWIKSPNVSRRVLHLLRGPLKNFSHESIVSMLVKVGGLE